VQFDSDMQVRGQPAAHYQLWLNGTTVLQIGGDALPELSDEVRAVIEQSTYKYDFWISLEGRLVQQNIDGTPIPELVPPFFVFVAQAIDSSPPGISLQTCAHLHTVMRRKAKRTC
jgi:hypothetical protein